MFVNHFYLFSTLVIYHRKSMVGVIATKIPLYGPKRRPTCRPLDELYAHVIPAQAGIQTDRSLGSCFRNTDRQSRCEHATFSSSVVPLAGFLPVIARSPGDEAIPGVVECLDCFAPLATYYEVSVNGPGKLFHCINLEIPKQVRNDRGILRHNCHAELVSASPYFHPRWFRWRSE